MRMTVTDDPVSALRAIRSNSFSSTPEIVARGSCVVIRLGSCRIFIVGLNEIKTFKSCDKPKENSDVQFFPIQRNIKKKIGKVNCFCSSNSSVSFFFFTTLVWKVFRVKSNSTLVNWIKWIMNDHGRLLFDYSQRVKKLQRG